MLRLVDTVIFVYFDREHLLAELLRLPDLAETSSVIRELRSWQPIQARLQECITAGTLELCDIDPGDPDEATHFEIYSRGHRLGEGEATSIAVAVCRGYMFISHDREAIIRSGTMGVSVGGWPDLLDEMVARGLISSERRNTAVKRIRERLHLR